MPMKTTAAKTALPGQHRRDPSIGVMAELQREFEVGARQRVSIVETLRPTPQGGMNLMSLGATLAKYRNRLWCPGGVRSQKLEYVSCPPPFLLLQGMC